MKQRFVKKRLMKKPAARQQALPADACSEDSHVASDATESWSAGPEIDWDLQMQCPGCMGIIDIADVDSSTKACPDCGTNMDDNDEELDDHE